MQKIRVYPALNGDCLLLTIDDFSILIDGGYVNTFNQHLKEDLSSLAKSLDLVIVTHIDGDHISGINKLFEQNMTSAITKIEHVWHNAFRHIQPYQKPNALLDGFNGKPLEQLAPASYLRDNEPKDENISAGQGSALATYVMRDRYSWNTHFDEKAVTIENRDVIELSPDIKLRLLSPDRQKLEELCKYWRRELYKMGYNVKGTEVFFDDAFEFVLAKDKPRKQYAEKKISAAEADFKALAAGEFNEDDSPTNGSSIAFVLEFGSKKILMLGDAHPGLVAQQLKKHYPGVTYPILFDLVKVSHHGSAENTSPELLELIDSEKFVFSTNGDKYDHPELVTIARVVTRPCKEERTLYFNYPTSQFETLTNGNRLQQYKYKLVISEGNQPLEIEL